MIQCRVGKPRAVESQGSAWGRGRTGWWAWGMPEPPVVPRPGAGVAAGGFAGECLPPVRSRKPGGGEVLLRVRRRPGEGSAVYVWGTRGCDRAVRGSDWLHLAGECFIPDLARFERRPARQDAPSTVGAAAARDWQGKPRRARRQSRRFYRSWRLSTASSSWPARCVCAQITG